jgi:hypothetical protein
MDANFANGYFETAPLSKPSDPDIPSFGMDGDSNGPAFTAIDTKVLGNLVKEVEKNEETREYHKQQDREVVPSVFIRGTNIDSLIHDFSLNTKQQLAFRIICNHAVGIHPPEEPQLLMGVFGEGGTGKSRLINLSMQFMPGSDGTGEKRNSSSQLPQQPQPSRSEARRYTAQRRFR